MIGRLALLVAALTAAIWVTVPLWEAAGSAPMVRPRPSSVAPPAAPQELNGPAAAPVRFAHKPPCDDGSEACKHWILKSERGDHWWLPYAFDSGPLTLSQDGWRVAYWRDDKDPRFVVRDLKTGKTHVLPAKIENTLFGDEPLFSVDGRYLFLEQDHLDKEDEFVRDPPVIVEVDSGTVTRLPVSDGDPVGWTTDGFVLVKSTRANPAPGHVSTAVFTVRSPAGKLVRQFSMPGNLFTELAVSPSGRVLAGVVQEVMPDDVRPTGIALVDVAGKPLRTAVPRAPSGWTVEEVVGWDGEDALVLRLLTPDGRMSLQTIELATGVMRSLGVEHIDVLDLLLESAESSVVIGKID